MKAISIVSAIVFLHIFGFIVLVNGCRSTSDPTYKDLSQNDRIAGPTSGQRVAPANRNSGPVSGQSVRAEKEEPVAQTTPEPERAKEPVAKRPAPASTDGNVYIVKKGDSLSLIAHRNKITVGELAKANDLPLNVILQTGKKLVIPPPSKTKTSEGEGSKTADGEIYVVKKGDALSLIARKKGVTISQIQAANPKLKGTNIYAGQKLVIPSKSSDKKAETETKKSEEKPPQETPAPETAEVVDDTSASPSPVSGQSVE